MLSVATSSVKCLEQYLLKRYWGSAKDQLWPMDLLSSRGENTHWLEAGGWPSELEGTRGAREGDQREKGQSAELGRDWVSPQGQLQGEHTQTPSSLLLEACGLPLWGYNGAQAPAPFSLLKPLSSVTLTGPTGQHHVSLGPRSLLVHNFPRLCCILTCTRGNFLP